MNSIKEIKDNVHNDDNLHDKYKFWFRINNQTPFVMSGLNYKSYLLLNDNDYELYKCIVDLLKNKTISNKDEHIETMWKSNDGVQYKSININFLDVPTCSKVQDPKQQQLSLQSLECHKITLSNSTTISQSFQSPDSNPVINALKNASQPISSTKSDAWDYFKKISKTEAKCNLCEKSYKSSGNTTNLKDHLKRKHGLFVKRTISTTDSDTFADDLSTSKKRLKSQDIHSGPLAKIFERTNSFAAGGTKADEITNAVLYMIAADQMALSTVEHDGFKGLMKIVAPLYSLPSRTTMTRLMHAKYKMLKEKIIDELNRAESYCITCDVWTDISNQSYLGITIHYLSEDGCSMKSRCLSVEPLYESHTGDNLRISLVSRLQDFHLDFEKITAVISDSAANITKCIVDEFGKDRRLPCFAHLLSHLVPAVFGKMNSVQLIIEKVKKIVTLVRRSVKATDQLKKLQIRDGRTEGTVLKFIQSVETRWNSSLHMLERFLLLEDYVYPTISKCANPPDMLTSEEMKVLKELVLIMKPIEFAITEIGGDSYPTCSVLIPIIRCMTQAINNVTVQTDICQQFQHHLLDGIDSKFMKLEDYSLLATSTILDPRFKRIHFNSALAASRAISEINKMIKRNFKKEDRSQTKVEKTSNPSDSFWSFHDQLAVTKIDSINVTADGTCFELKEYLNQPLLPRKENPLTHWKTLKNSFPNLYPIAIKYLSVIGTSVPSERLFSEAGAIKTRDRNRLTGTNLDELLFLSSFNRAEWGQ